jgi:hypothetical protein
MLLCRKLELSAHSARARCIYRLKQNKLVNSMLVMYKLTVNVGVELDYLHKGKNTTNPCLLWGLGS